VASRVSSWRRIRSTILLGVFLALVLVVTSSATDAGVGQWELLITLVAFVVGCAVIWWPRKPLS
jgi:hypothetical protein